jgi:hypothetical protein
VKKVLIGTLIAASAGVMGFNLGTLPNKIERDRIVHEQLDPQICAAEEDADLVSCTDGTQADYKNGAWWPTGTPQNVKDNWNK